MTDKNVKGQSSKEHKHDGHDHAGHDSHNHDAHDHAGHDHAGHDHHGHDHEGHSHEGHDHTGHDHAGHDHDIPHTKIVPRKENTTGIAEEGNLVVVHYTGTLDSGETFDSSKERDPIEFVLGEHAVIPGFELAIVSMKKGDSKKITIEAANAYGDVNPQLKQEVPREALGDITPEVGMILALQHPMAQQPIPVKVVEVTPETVTIDLNHPLAGQRLHFELELVDVK